MSEKIKKKYYNKSFIALTLSGRILLIGNNKILYYITFQKIFVLKESKKMKNKIFDMHIYYIYINNKNIKNITYLDMNSYDIDVIAPTNRVAIAGITNLTDALFKLEELTTKLDIVIKNKKKVISKLKQIKLKLAKVKKEKQIMETHHKMLCDLLKISIERDKENIDIICSQTNEIKSLKSQIENYRMKSFRKYTNYF